MKKNELFVQLFATILFCFIVHPIVSQSQQQINNPGFENWEGVGLEAEPVGWNSFMNTESPNTMYLSILKNKQIEESYDTRPGSSGSKSVRVFARDTVILGFAITANGNMTTGRIYAADLDLSLAGNKTKREEEGFNHPFTTTPDSLTVWVRNNCLHPEQEAFVSAIIHNDCDYFVPLSGINDYENVVGIATQTFQNEGNVWKRLSVPFNYELGQSNDPQYILMIFNTNVGIDQSTQSGSDEIFIDDILMIYQPEVSVNPLGSNNFMLNPDAGTAIQIGFTLSGTMSPGNLNAEDNVVTAELSDANGSFETPTILGSIVTDESGIIVGMIPPTVAPGEGYRVRVTTTNYPMVSADNGTDIVLSYPTYTIALSANPEEGGSVAGGGTFPYGTEVTIEASPNAGYEFISWTENGATISTNPTETFVVQSDRNIVADFNPLGSYYATVTVSPQGAGAVIGGGSYTEGETVTVQTTPNEGYTFLHWEKDGEEVGTELSYSFVINSNTLLTAHYSVNNYTVVTKAEPITAGTLSGGGLYPYGETATVQATPYPEYIFVNWTIDNEVVSTQMEYTFTVANDVEIVGHFRKKKAVSEITAEHFSIYVDRQQLCIETKEKGDLYLFNVMGQLERKYFISQGITRIFIPKSGVYLIRFHDRTKKIVIPF